MLGHPHHFYVRARFALGGTGICARIALDAGWTASEHSVCVCVFLWMRVRWLLCLHVRASRLGYVCSGYRRRELFGTGQW